MLASSSDSVLIAGSFVVLALGWGALPVIWWFFFRGKDKSDGPKLDVPPEIAPADPVAVAPRTAEHLRIRGRGPRRGHG